MPGAWSRRKPYPWSVRLNETGLMVPGEMIGRSVRSMANALPNDQEYGSDDIYTQRSAAFRGPLLGMGEGSQRSHELNRYAHGHNTWVSGLWRGKGPRVRWQTPPVSDGGPVLGLFAARHGSTDAGFSGGRGGVVSQAASVTMSNSTKARTNVGMLRVSGTCDGCAPAPRRRLRSSDGAGRTSCCGSRPYTSPAAA